MINQANRRPGHAASPSTIRSKPFAPVFSYPKEQIIESSRYSTTSYAHPPEPVLRDSSRMIRHRPTRPGRFGFVSHDGPWARPSSYFKHQTSHFLLPFGFVFTRPQLIVISLNSFPCRHLCSSDRLGNWLRFAQFVTRSPAARPLTIGFVSPNRPRLFIPNSALRIPHFRGPASYFELQTSNFTPPFGFVSHVRAHGRLLPGG